MSAPTTAARRLEPRHADEVAQLLREADDRRQAVAVCGNGTKSGWGRPPSRVDVVLSLAQLREPVEHCAGDLTVTAPAGATLGDVNRALGREGQWLPLDPWAGERSTIGGLLAANDSGPRRVRHGAPRDLVIGVEFALPDGRRAKAGGRVVKNVAGYDLGRLLCGSFGALAVITAATFKLAPLTAASRTVAIDAGDGRALQPLIRALALAPVTPSAVEVDTRDWQGTRQARLLVRFESTATAADAQAAHVAGLAPVHGMDATLVQGADEAEVWADYEAAYRPDSGTMLKVGVLPGQVAAVLESIAAQARAGGLAWRAGGRATLGVLLVHVDGAAASVATFAGALRSAAAAAHGHVAVLSAPADVRAAVPPWDDVGPSAAIMRLVKAQFDPHGTLCPGGGPGGTA